MFVQIRSLPDRELLFISLKNYTWLAFVLDFRGTRTYANLKCLLRFLGKYSEDFNARKFVRHLWILSTSKTLNVVSVGKYDPPPSTREALPKYTNSFQICWVN